MLALADKIEWRFGFVVAGMKYGVRNVAVNDELTSLWMIELHGADSFRVVDYASLADWKRQGEAVEEIFPGHRVTNPLQYPAGGFLKAVRIRRR